MKRIIEKLFRFDIDVDNFFFSHGYVAFFYTLERCNYFLNLFIENRSQPKIDDDLKVVINDRFLNSEFSFHTAIQIIKKVN